MDLELAFSILNGLAVIGWLPLIFAPRARWTAPVSEWAVSALLGVAYVFFLVSGWGRGGGGFGSLAGVAQLFTVKELLLAGWIHYLAFDLLVGARIVRQATEAGIAHIFVVPILLLTFMFGPAGFLSFALLRLAWRMRATSVVGGAR